MYFVAYQLQQFLEEDEWEFTREAKAVWDVSKYICVVVENKIFLNSVYGPMIKKILHKKFSASKMLIIDVSN